MPVKLIEAGLVYISRAGGLSALQESGELVHSSSAAGPAAGPSGRGGGAGETKGNDTVVHVGDPGRSCCGMADPLLAATLIGKPLCHKISIPLQWRARHCHPKTVLRMLAHAVQWHDSLSISSYRS